MTGPELPAACAALAGAVWAATAPTRVDTRSGRVGQRLERTAGRVADALLARMRGPQPRGAVEGLCAAVVAELRAGASPGRAMILATDGGCIVPRARAAALLGEPIAPALVADAEARGSPALAGVAACWRVAADSGAGLADGLERVAALARTERRVAGDLRAETAAPKATARILGMLPLLGLLLGQLLGAQPLSWLLGSHVGWLCLLVGGGFLVAGRAWTARILHQAMPDAAPGRT